MYFIYLSILALSAYALHVLKLSYRNVPQNHRHTKQAPTQTKKLPVAEPQVAHPPTLPQITFGVELEFILSLPIAVLQKYRKRHADDHDGKLHDWLSTKLNAQPALTNQVKNHYFEPIEPQKNYFDYSRWNLMHEGSIYGSDAEVSQLYKIPISLAEIDYAHAGVELVSPVFRWNEQSVWFPQLSQIQSAVKRVAFNNRTTGLHVHLGIDGNAGLDINTVKMILLIWAASEEAIETMHPTHRRNGRNVWCKSLFVRIITLLEEQNVPESNQTRLEKLELFARMLTHANEFYEFWRICGGSQAKVRVSGSTVENAGRIIAGAGKKLTVEFREHTGSLNAVEIRHWVGFCRKMLLYAFEQASLNQKWTEDFIMQVYEDTATLEKLFELIGLEREEREYYFQKRKDIVLWEEANAREEGRNPDYEFIVVA